MSSVPPDTGDQTEAGPKNTPLSIPYLLAGGFAAGAGAGAGFAAVMAIVEMMK